jgi:hypothetical protein
MSLTDVTRRSGGTGPFEHDFYSTFGREVDVAFDAGCDEVGGLRRAIAVCEERKCELSPASPMLLSVTDSRGTLRLPGGRWLLRRS